MTSYPGEASVLSVLVRAFRTPDLRKKLLFTLAIIALFRLGANLPAPGISERNVSYCSGGSRSGGVFAILNLLSGNSLLHLTVFAIGILPYITASIIVQMLIQVIQLVMIYAPFAVAYQQLHGDQPANPLRMRPEHG